MMETDPDAEVVALSPKTLMATNRFICEVCNKGFQREQNLQLHRRGHNLPWKLKQKTTKEVKKKVYLCPEPTCVHHDPSRALGDLTGIKKHYSRKHGEKKWKCEKCSKRYAVQSDWKAHSKTCGTREYRCDCGTLFSRRDSFITHRAFCDALAQETARHPPPLNSIGTHLYGTSNYMGLGLSQVGTQISSIQDPNNNQTAADILKLGGGGASRSSQFDHLLPPSMGSSSSSSFRPQQQAMGFVMEESNQIFNQEHQSQHGLLGNSKPFQGLMQFPPDDDNNNNNNNNNASNASSAANLFNLSFLSNSGNNGGAGDYNLTSSGLLMSDNFNNENGGNGGTNNASNLFSNNLMSDQMTSNIPSLFSSSVQNNNMVPQISSMGQEQPPPPPPPQSMNVSGGGSDRLTRDFLGVGQIVRNMRGGIGISRLSSERNSNITAPTSQQSFGERGNFQ
ncbi:hypothetical protein Godav_006684 [Gossypium davidsonii]|uniref:C2H2-type domain-containing protein n=1 Tax=Gossypium davidsonii TaxID=34287 RepID=A0A7J8S5F3_GOSDV|nr:hypothetical protein [Gossypium davidsonii]